MVIVGSARISENNNAGWDGKAKAGDQTGREVSTQEWYKHSKGWVVLRPKDKAVAEMLAYDMEAACSNQNIGYDQSERLTLYNAAKKVGFDCAKVTAKVETDCSALVRVCLAYAGITVGNIRTTGEAEAVMKTGQFEKLTEAKYTESPDYLKRGDILVTAKVPGHTVIVLSNGDKAVKKKVQAARYRDAILKGTYIVTTSLNLRYGAGTSFEVIKVLKPGSKVRCYGWYNLASGKKWLYVADAQDVEGYCSSTYLKRV